MFLWYRQSVLAAVYLSDASGTGDLANAIWFKRGWTLQELLLPRTVLFYTRHWTLYRPSSIHKEDRVILSGLERESGVSLSHLANFYSGMSD